MVTMYSTPWCGYCLRLKSQMERANIAFRVVDIEQDPAAEEFVKGVNGGNATVPTLRISPPGGRSEIILTNPTIVQVREAVAGS